MFLLGCRWIVSLFCGRFCYDFLNRFSLGVLKQIMILEYLVGRCLLVCRQNGILVQCQLLMLMWIVMKVFVLLFLFVFFFFRYFGIFLFWVKFVVYCLCMVFLCMLEWLMWCRDFSIFIFLLWMLFVFRLDGGDIVIM